MAITKSRKISKILDASGKIKTTVFDSDHIVTSGQKSIETKSSGVSLFHSSADTLPVSVPTGTQALVTSTRSLYIHNSAGWYKIATINNFNPQWVTEPNGTYTLAIDGSITSITVLATDSDDVPILYTATGDSDFNTFATITHDSDKHKTFTVTPTDSESGAAAGGTGTVTFTASDGTNQVTASSTFSLTFSTSNSHFTELLIKADSTQTDAQTDTTSNHVITEVGDVTSTAFTPYHPGGYSYYFDGAGDYLSIPDSSDFDFGNGDFTIEFWAYQKGVNADGTGSVVGQWAASNRGWVVYLSSTFILFSFSTNGTNYYNVSDGSGISYNEWTHVAIVRDGNTMKMYKNGTETYNAVFNSTIYNSSRILEVGANSSGTYGDYLGYLKDVRIVKGSAVYTSAFTPPTEPLTAISNTSLLTCHLPYVADGSTNSHTITVNGNVHVNRTGPYDTLGYTPSDHGGSLYFDGTGDYVTFPTSSNLNLGNGDFTIELWVYMTAYESTGFNTFIMPSESAGPDWQLDYKNGSSELRWLPYHGAAPDTTTLNVSGVTMNLNVWYHIAVVRSGNFLSMYLNGKHLKTAAYNNTVDHNSSSTFYVGAREQGATFDRRFTGYMTDLRIVKSSALYDSDIVVPTSPLTNVGGTGVLTFNNKNDIWDAAKGALFTKNGNVAASATQTKFASTSSIYFDGSGDYIDFVKKDEYHFGSSVDFTIEGWWYLNSVSGRPPFIAMGTGVDATPAHYSDWNLYYNSSNKLNFYKYSNSSSQLRQFAWTPVVDTWYHIAVCRSGTNLRAFINGTQIGSTITDSTAWTGASGARPLRIGRWQYGGGTNGYLNGYAQDIRITKGLARYTTNFTPPSQQFSG
tara:strand:- start:4675 stop:7248 length:2574 start_codon:yes stop_codon:yes gene_type:complete